MFRRHVAEQVLADYVFPLPSLNQKGVDIDEVVWTERMLLTMKFLDQKSVASMLNLTGLKGL